jgi:hypothetical protein
MGPPLCRSGSRSTRHLPRSRSSLRESLVSRKKSSMSKAARPLMGMRSCDRRHSHHKDHPLDAPGRTQPRHRHAMHRRRTKASRSLSKSFPEDRKLFVDIRAIGAPRMPSWFLVLTFPMPHQHSVDRRHHIPKMSFKVRNRAEYEAGLRRLGSLTFGSRTQRWNAGGPVDRTAERAIRMRRFRRA